MILRSATIASSDPTKRLRLRLKQHVVEYVVDGHDGGLGPRLHNLLVAPFRSFKRGGFISKLFLHLGHPRRIATPALPRQLEVHPSSDAHEGFHRWWVELGIELKHNFHRFLPFFSIIQARVSSVGEVIEPAATTGEAA